MRTTFITIILVFVLIFINNDIYCQNSYVVPPPDAAANSFKWFQLPSQSNSSSNYTVITQGCSAWYYNNTFWVFGRNYQAWNNSVWSFDLDNGDWSLINYSNLTWQNTNTAIQNSVRWFQSNVYSDFGDQWWMFGGVYLPDWHQIYGATGNQNWLANATQAGWNNDFLIYFFNNNTYKYGIYPANQKTSPLPSGRQNSPIVRYNNTLFMFGLCYPTNDTEGNTAITNDLWTLDIDNPKWLQNTVLLDLPQWKLPYGRCGHGFITVPNTTYGLIFGGHNANINYYFNDLWKFDFVAQNFTQIIENGIAKPAGRSYFVFAYYQGYFLIFNGDSDAYEHFNDFWAYSIAQNTWSNLIPLGENPILPISRAQACGLIYNNNFMVYSGRTYAPPEDDPSGYDIDYFLNDLWVFKLGCPNNCSGNGNCSVLFCNCDDCYSGQDCSQLICFNDTSVIQTTHSNSAPVLTGVIVGAVIGACFLISIGSYVARKAHKYRKFKMRQKALGKETAGAPVVTENPLLEMKPLN